MSAASEAEKVTWLERLGSNRIAQIFTRQDRGGVTLRERCEYIIQSNPDQLGDLLAEGFDCHFHQEVFLNRWNGEDTLALQTAINRQQLQRELAAINVATPPPPGFDLQYLCSITQTQNLLIEERGTDGGERTSSVSVEQPVRILVRDDLLLVQVLTLASGPTTYRYITGEPVTRVTNRLKCEDSANSALSAIERVLRIEVPEHVDFSEGAKNVCSRPEVCTIEVTFRNGGLGNSTHNVPRTKNMMRGVREDTPEEFATYLRADHIREVDVCFPIATLGMMQHMLIKMYPSQGYMRAPRQLHGSRILELVESLL